MKETSKKSKANNYLYCIFIKRILDVVLAVSALLLFWWIFATIAAAVRINMGKSIIYSSERMGMDEKTFKIYKFRSMTNEVDENGVLLPGPQRLTKFGRMLRSTSMDELPSIINILKGDLSIVGPRPLLVKYQPYYYEHERVRHNVRPGLTGWAQVNGRNAVSWDEKFKMDIFYVENMSFFLDFKILIMTVYKVMKRSDIIQDSQQTGSLYVVRANMSEKNSRGEN